MPILLQESILLCTLHYGHYNYGVFWPIINVIIFHNVYNNYEA